MVLMERTNIRYLEPSAIRDPIDLIVIDVSFISLTLVLPCVVPYLAASGFVITLIKPQFELDPDSIGKGGIVRDEAATDRWAGRGFRLAAHTNLPPALAVTNAEAWDKGCDCQALCRDGKLTGASPEGRLAGEPLAYSLSPAQGRDREGITAALNSLARIPHHLAAASSSAILEVTPSVLDQAGRDQFVSLLMAAVDKGIGQLQFNVVSADTLRAAQENPDRYSNLCVRVSGFSQRFCLLDHDMQEHIIARTKHAR